MPWKETHVMNERMRFVVAYESGEASVSELCRQFGISRKTAYKWIDRYEAEGVQGLADRSRAPLHPAHGLDEDGRRRILRLRGQHPTWGPRKLKAWLEWKQSGRVWPAASTIGELLSRHGLVRPRRRRRRASPSPGPLATPTEANDLWCVDFKGWFRLGDGRRCTPLTIMDGWSRYLLCCQAMMGPTGYADVLPLFESTFRRHGLPGAIRSDNGPPFASTGLMGLTRLSVWWMKLGIALERIEPGHPEQNGRHERMHRTLKEDAISPPSGSGRSQQRCFNAFRKVYNEERPHEALGGRPPAMFHTPSGREYPRRLHQGFDYPQGWPVRRVKASGQIMWGGRALRISGALVGERIGLEPTEEGRWRIHFGPMALGVFDERRWRIEPMRPEVALGARGDKGR